MPISRQAMVLLELLKQISGDKELLFPGDYDATKVMSENTVIVHCMRWAMTRKLRSAGMVLGRWREGRSVIQDYGVTTR